MKPQERLSQIEKRIADLKRKADSIREQLPKQDPIKVAQSVMTGTYDFTIPEQPRRRGRKKLNEAE